MSSELKVCPLCGSEVKLAYGEGDAALVVCRNKYCSARTDAHDEFKEAVDQWNKITTDEIKRINDNELSDWKLM